MRPVPPAERARRAARLAAALTRGLAAGPRLARTDVLRARAQEVLRALGLTWETSTPTLSAPPHDAPPHGGGRRGGGTRRPGTLIVADHISWLDVLALFAVEPATVLAKREVAGWPVFGTLAVRAGAQFIDRDRIRALPGTVAQVAGTLRGGSSVLVFPQGTTWCTEAGDGFRRAMFQAALDAGSPVRPVTVSYRQGGAPSTVAAFLGDDTFTASLRRVLGARDLVARVTAHPVLPAHPTRRALAAAAHTAIRGTKPPAHT